MATAPETRTALEIAETLLTRADAALEAGDFAAMAPCFTLPYRHSTAEGETRLDQLSELEALFQKMQEQFRSLGVTRIDRVVTEARFAGPGRIAATHETHLFAGETPVIAPYQAISDLAWADGDWRVQASHYTATRDKGHAAALTPDRPGPGADD
ncbi:MULTISPECIES: hypothetical protein [unclassified Roseivivax]|uniref:hypothetical protein n=1 Tax=Roseivivax sp. GX 12232 TaxID=2900547 RepID=UPI001E619A3F|nr:hypothetical protein [Roseivivax sp. GX 12232]MCE0506821.1 hypothetical protein [Roseivivax sp. GX 12232]